MKKFSDYSILSERLENGGYVLQNGISGAIDLISDDLKIEVENNLSGHCNNNLEEVLPKDIYERYVERGHIVECDKDEGDEVVLMANVINRWRKNKIKIVIMPDLDCNYRCTYCFERPMQNAISLFPKATAMSFAQIDKLYCVIDQWLADPDKIVDKSITLYGGEPLNKKNREIIKVIVERGIERGFTFKAVTNGHNLDSFIDLLGSKKINFLQISIDGVKAIHDKQRVAMDGTSSYDRIMKNLLSVLRETDVVITLRTHIDRNNFIHVEKLLKALDDNGVLSYKRVHVMLVLIKRKNQAGVMIKDGNIIEIESYLKPVLAKYKQVSLGSFETTVKRKLLSALKTKTAFALKTDYCAANCAMRIMHPDGRVSSCWEMLNDDIGHIGDYDETGITYNANKLNWEKRSVEQMGICKDCPYCFVCMGGCASFSLANAHSINVGSCCDIKEVYPHILADSVNQFLNELGV